MKVELTKEWCMNMAKIEARAEELHEGCKMPMEQARELAESEAKPAPNLELFAAFGAADAAKEQDLRGYYPMAARVLADRAKSLKIALDQKHAEYDDMKSLLLGNARNLKLEGEQARQTAEYWKAEYLAGNTRIGELHDEVDRLAKQRDDYRHGMTVQMEAVASMVDLLHRMLESPTTQISVTWKDAVRQALALGPNDRFTGRP